MKSLVGRNALVTGAGSGIGRAIALDLAGAGANVSICGRRIDPLEETKNAILASGGEAEISVCDLMDPEAIEIMANQLLEKRNCIDILVNNAGFSSKIRSARYIGPDEWRDVMNVNTLGPAMLTKALLPAMIDKGSGHVVMISSMAAIRSGVMSGAVYGAAKSASRVYMNALDAEVRKYGIRCTTILPGEVDTPILDNRALPPNEEVRGLMMRPEDISSAVMMAVLLPQRANVIEIAITATVPRDMTDDVKAALSRR
tara:strand:+ start:2431 stop:3201 length:771 start_codon:yes stop_codon:yes gene_type:complete